jgi:hypothetical protein
MSAPALSVREQASSDAGNLRAVRAYRVVLGIAIITVLAVRLREGTGNIIDDAYLTLRDARNVAQGAGVVYNAGETVLGTTTPLFALVYGAIGAVVGVDWIPLSAVLGNALADVLAVLLLVRWIGRAASSPLAGLAAGVAYGLAPRAIEYSSGGMEAPLYTLLILITLYEAARGHQWTSGAVAGLAIVCRLDGALVGLVALVWLAVARRRVPWRFVLIATIVAAPWLVYASRVYPWGPIPQSIIAKAHRPWLIGPADALSHLVIQLAAAAIGRPLVAGAAILGERVGRTNGFLGIATTLAVASNIGLLLVGARRLGSDGMILLGFGVAYAALFAVGNPLMLGWYQVPLEAILAALFAGAAAAIPSIRVRHAALAALVAVPIVTLLVGRDTWMSRVLHEHWDKRREAAYFATAERLRPVLTQGATVMGSENGALGWGLRGRVIDTVGLITPGAERFYPIPASQLAIDYAVPPQLVLAMRPDFFVSLEIFIRQSCLVDPAFQAAYAVDESLSDRSQSTFGSQGLLVFRRVPAATNESATPGSRPSL